MIPLHLNFCKSIPDRALTLLLAASFCSPDCHDFLPCLFQFLHCTQFLLIKNFVKSWLVLFFSFRPCLHSFCCFRFLNWISSLCSLTLLTRAPKFAVILWAPKTASLEVLLTKFDYLSLSWISSFSVKRPLVKHGQQHNRNNNETTMNNDWIERLCCCQNSSIA